MFGMIIPYVTSQIVGLPRVAKIIGGAYLTGALVAAIQATIEGETMGTTVKRSALSWGSVMGYGYKGKSTGSAKSTKSKKSKKANKKAALEAIMAIQKQVDKAAAAGNDAEVLKLHIELAALLKKHHAPKAIQNECATVIKDLKREIKKAKATAPAPASDTFASAVGLKNA